MFENENFDLKLLIQRLSDRLYLSDDKIYKYGSADGYAWADDICNAVRFDTEEDAFDAMFNYDEDFFLLKVYVKKII